MLTTTDLIERMPPTVLAEMIVAIECAGNCDMDELETSNAMRTALVNNVGEDDAYEMIDAVQG